MDRDPLRQVGAGLSPRERGRGLTWLYRGHARRAIVRALQGLRSDAEGAEDQEPPGGWIASDGPLLVNEESAR